MTPRVLLIGAAGTVGSALWPRLQHEFTLRLFDRRPVPNTPPSVESVLGDIADEPQLTDAMDDVDAVVHLAGNPYAGAQWSDLVSPNLEGVQNVLNIAASRAVPKVVFASSCHAAGLYDVDRTQNVDPRWTPRPCCPYGVSKVYGEVCGRFFAERTSLRVINLRLGAVSERPLGTIGLHFWLSFHDLATAFAAAIQSDLKYGIYYAASANSRLNWNLEPGMSDLGFTPTDNAETYVAQIDPSIEGPPCYRGAV